MLGDGIGRHARNCCTKNSTIFLFIYRRYVSLVPRNISSFSYILPPYFQTRLTRNIDTLPGDLDLSYVALYHVIHGLKVGFFSFFFLLFMCPLHLSVMVDSFITRQQ